MKTRKKTVLYIILLVGCVAMCVGIIARRGHIPSEPLVIHTSITSPASPADVLNVGDMNYEELLALSRRTWLKRLVTDGNQEYEALLYLRKALPECDIHWMYEFNGQLYSDSTTELTVDTTDGLTEALHCLPDVKTVDMTSFTPDTEALDSLITAYPQVQFLFYVHFGDWTVRSDITCFSTLRPSFLSSAPRYTSEDLYPLFKYCKHLRALDCGHNYLDDLTELGTLTELQVLILGDNKRITDISPLGNLVNLEYLEFFYNTKPTDFSVLNNFTKMKALDICYLPGLKDVDFIENMPELEMLWAKNTGVSYDTWKECEEKYPNIHFHYNCSQISSTCDGWRTTEDNLSIRKAFTNWKSVIEFRSMEDVEYDPNATLTIPQPSLK